MKKLILVLLMVTSFAGVNAQNKTQEKKINYFVDAAVTEFQLNKDQQKELLAARIAYIDNFMAIMKDAKDGAISDEEKKTKNNELSQSFNQKLIKITGKTMNEIQPFLTRMREELKNI